MDCRFNVHLVSLIREAFGFSRGINFLQNMFSLVSCAKEQLHKSLQMSYNTIWQFYDIDQKLISLMSGIYRSHWTTIFQGLPFIIQRPKNKMGLQRIS